MDMVEKVNDNGNNIAIIIRASFKKNDIHFFTPHDYSQQLAYMKRPKEYEIEPHVHKVVKREVHLTQEVLFIKSGRVRVDFYDNEKRYLESRILEVGDVILLAGGGHGFQMLEETEMIEVKQGPFSGDNDKVRFEPKVSDIIIK